MRRAITGWIHEISSLSITFGGAKWAALARRTTARASVGCTIVNSTFESMNTRALFHDISSNLPKLWPISCATTVHSSRTKDVDQLIMQFHLSLMNTTYWLKIQLFQIHIVCLLVIVDVILYAYIMFWAMQYQLRHQNYKKVDANVSSKLQKRKM